jgi:hypothetical protein
MVIASAFSASCFANGFDRALAMEFYQRILSCSEITLPCLESAGLIRSVGAGSYVFVDAPAPRAFEQDSGEKIANAVGLSVLMLPDLPGLTGVPVIDAILFDNSGQPVANLGLKTFLGTTTNGTNAAHKMLRRSKSSFKELYNVRYLSENYGFEVDPHGEIVPKFGTKDQELRSTLLNGFFKLAGMSESSNRPVWMGIDLSNDPHKSLQILKGRSGVGPIPFDGTFFDIVDNRIHEEFDRLSVVNIDLLLSDVRGPADIKKYLILVNRALLSIDKAGHKLIPLKKRLQPCFEYLMKAS